MTVYLDHAASAPVRPEVSEAMVTWLTDCYGNPSGAHSVARRARRVVEEARDVVAAALGAQSDEIVFTSGGTESDNLALSGAFARRAGAIVCSAVEHPAVLRTAEAIACAHGAELRVVPVDADGLVDLDALDAACDRDVSVVSVMLVNNEVGTIQPLAEVSKIVRKRAPQALLHTDAVQALAWLALAEVTDAVDLISVSAHKLGGPQGVGALMVRDGVDLAPLNHGGGQERNRRSGTHNVAGIVGFAAGVQVTEATRSNMVDPIEALRDRLVDQLIEAAAARETTRRSTKVVGNAHLCFDGIESEALLVLLDSAGVCASAGSACASGALDPSPVLLAMGLDEAAALSSLRLSLGWTTTDSDVDIAVKVVADSVARLRELQ